ncbi:ATP-binding protein [Nocardioides mesophilus]|uniref:ATP-binding protein n=1 Tax=Nocardioides mesophilus TaxID=433659 RepID=A0A7G9RFY9_9ACTN|nr:ATP-binding protein [Nocardioides mesophilus]QNN54514.1 ATP-binding protein [Nocardioides mesophilus]
MSTSSLRAGRAPVQLRVPFAASSVAVARHKLKDWLQEAGCSTRSVDDARIVISELVGNSVRHAQPLPDGDILVSWQVEKRGLLISVTDGGSGTRPRTVHAPAGALAGRGMAIVESLAVTWWADKKQARSTVHAILEL